MNLGIPPDRLVGRYPRYMTTRTIATLALALGIAAVLILVIVFT